VILSHWILLPIALRLRMPSRTALQSVRKLVLMTATTTHSTIVSLSNKILLPIVLILTMQSRTALQSVRKSVLMTVTMIQHMTAMVLQEIPLAYAVSWRTSLLAPKSVILPVSLLHRPPLPNPPRHWYLLPLQFLHISVPLEVLLAAQPQSPPRLRDLQQCRIGQVKYI